MTHFTSRFDAHHRGMSSADPVYHLAPLSEYEAWCAGEMSKLNPVSRGTFRKSILNDPKKLRAIVHGKKRGNTSAELSVRFGCSAENITKVFKRLPEELR